MRKKILDFIKSIISFLTPYYQQFIRWRKARLKRFRSLVWYRKLGNIMFTLFWMFLLYLFLVDINFLWLFGKSPTLKSIGNPSQSSASLIISDDGKVIGKYFNENRTPVKYLPITFPSSLIISEAEL